MLHFSTGRFCNFCSWCNNFPLEDIDREKGTRKSDNGRLLRKVSAIELDKKTVLKSMSKTRPVRVRVGQVDFFGPVLGIGLRSIGGGSYSWKLGLVQISGRTGLLNGSALWAQTKNVHESG